ncbi:MAG: alpha/beta fold hydrolase [Mesorhizobium sp.]
MTEELYARQKGAGKTVIVLLHGFGGSNMDWNDIQPDLARDGLVLAYDLPGHGRSLAHTAAGNASAMAKAILADLEARGIDRAHVVGFSMGGAVATLMGMRGPAKVASLTLLAPGGFGPEISEPLLKSIANPATAGELRAGLSGMGAPGFDMPTKNVAVAAAMRSLPGQGEKLAEIAAKISKDGKQGEIPREAMAALAMPVTVVWGDLDPVLPYAHSRGLPPQFVLITVPSVGHMLPEEARKTVIQAIRQTMRR